jgi:hypothetical protein
MDLAASRMLVPALMTVGCVVIRARIRTSLTSFPAATAWTVSLGDDADGLLGLVVVHDHQK